MKRRAHKVGAGILSVGYLMFFIQPSWSEESSNPRPVKPAAPKIISSEKTHELKVTLFGQPCLLVGPFEPTLLKAIHEISPEQIPTVTSYQASDAVPTLKKNLDKLTSTHKTPAALDRYRERLIKRLEAELAFSQALNTLKKNHKTAAFFEAIQPHISAKQLKNLQTLAKKLGQESSRSLESSQTIDQLSETYSEAIEPNPEEDFHLAAQKLRIKYDCSFDEASPAAEDSEE